MWFGSRRRFAASLLAPLLRPLRANDESRGHSRTYRADAVILFLGVTIYRRPAVGGGQASYEESGEGASLRRTLFFAGGSDPKRAHGLNRLGWIRETVTGPVNAAAASEYFGVMTSSPEESLEHARKAVEEPAGARSVFNAVSGRHTPGHTRSALTHFDYPASSNWSDRGLIDQAHATFQGDTPWRETSWPKSPNQTPPGFLLELATLLQQHARRGAGRYIYCEQEYTMELETAAPDRDRLIPIHAKVRNLKTGKEYPFRVWMAADSLVPVRIEYQARSYLRLTFEAIG